MKQASQVVVVRRAGAAYPATAAAAAGMADDARDLVRAALAGLGRDAEAEGSPAWNPLRGLVLPGQTVLIKPNLVLDRHPRGQDIFCLITHGSVLRALVDLVVRALEGRGRILLGDSPIQSTDFARVAELTGLRELVELHRRTSKIDIALIDFRQVHAERDAHGHIRAWKDVPGDPAGYATFDLGADSLLAPIGRDSEKFRVSNYGAADTQQYHRAGSHRYVIAKSVLDADVIFSVPKLKTHCKVGVTLGLKNFVGTVGRKQCLAHHREGGAAEGGDEYPGRSRFKRISEHLERAIDGRRPGALRSLLHLGFRINERVIRELGVDPVRDGGWYGNDTCWRMTLDLVRIARYGRADGTMADTTQRKIVTLIDGIVGGENEGPLEATPVAAGTVVAGDDPALTDLAAATFMGLDYSRIPLLREATRLARWPLADQPADDLSVQCNGRRCTLAELANAPERLSFRPPRGWIGHEELAVTRSS